MSNIKTICFQLRLSVRSSSALFRLWLEIRLELRLLFKNDCSKYAWEINQVCNPTTLNVCTFIKLQHFGII